MCLPHKLKPEELQLRKWKFQQIPAFLSPKVFLVIQLRKLLQTLNVFNFLSTYKKVVGDYKSKVGSGLSMEKAEDIEFHKNAYAQCDQSLY